MWKYGIIYKHYNYNIVYNNSQVPWPSLKYLILIYYYTCTRILGVGKTKYGQLYIISTIEYWLHIIAYRGKYNYIIDPSTIKVTDI